MTRRIIIFIGAVLLALTAGAALPRPWLEPVFHHGGYYFMWAAFSLWGLLLLRQIYGRTGILLKRYYPVLLLCAGIMALIFHLSPPQFKILADETNLIGVSMAMHYDKTVSVPVQGLALDYAGYDYQGGIDQRPLGYPFFVGLCHGLLGYSPDNGFVVNFLAGMMALFFLYLLLTRSFSGFYGLMGVLLTAACPVFAFWATSSGFETLHLFFVVFVFWSLDRFLTDRRVDLAELLFLSLVLLAHCRYEAVIFIAGLVTLWPWLINRDLIGRYRLPTLLCPFLMLPLIWQRRLNFFSPAIFVGETRQTADSLFGFGHLTDHFSPNLFVLFGLDRDYGFIPTVFVLAVAGLYLVLRRWRRPAHGLSGHDRAIIRYGLACGIALFLFYASFFWGDFSLAIDNRLALVFLPFLVVPAVYAVKRWTSGAAPFWRAALVFLAVMQIVHYWPVAEKQRLIQGKSLTYEYNRVLGFLEANYDLSREKVLIISDRANFYTIHGLGSVNFAYANQQTEKLRQMKRIYYDHVLVLQRPHPRTGVLPPGQGLTADYRLRRLAEIPVGPDYEVRISTADFSEAAVNQ